MTAIQQQSEPFHRIILYGRVPSKKNSKRRIQRGTHIFMVPSQQHADWHEEQMLYLRGMWPKNLVLTSVKRCELVFFAPDRRKADLSNKAESVMDLLVDAGVLKDDSWFVVPDLRLRLGGVDKEQPRVIIEVT